MQITCCLLVVLPSNLIRISSVQLCCLQLFDIIQALYQIIYVLLFQGRKILSNIPSEERREIQIRIQILYLYPWLAALGISSKRNREKCKSGSRCHQRYFFLLFYPTICILINPQSLRCDIVTQLAIQGQKGPHHVNCSFIC